MRRPIPNRASVWKIFGSVIVFVLISSLSHAQAPANDLCGNAILISSNPTCTNTSGTVVNATLTAGYSTTCGTIKYDVWYTFVAQVTNPTITLSADATPTNSTNFTNAGIQLLSGTVCTSLTSLFCSTIGAITTPRTINATGLTVGTAYYIRVLSTSATAAPTTKGLFNICVQNPAPANDNCTGATTLNPAATCVGTTGTLISATNSGTAGACGGATSSTTYDVWYKFTSTSSSNTIALSSLGSNLSAASTYVEVLQGTCAGGFTSLSCQNASASMVLNSLSLDTTYYVRVYTTAAPPSTSAGFSICITQDATNEDCTDAIPLGETTGATTTRTSFAGASTSGTATTCGLSSYPDIWYSFVATSAYPVITLSSLGTSLTTAKTYIQLFSGTCPAGLTSLACVSGATTFTTQTSYPAGLTIGNTYYIRISENAATLSGSTNEFNILVSDPTAHVDYGKSYVRVKGGIQSGSIQPGDTLQIRATFVVKNNTAYSCSFTDNIPANTVYVPNSLSILTNEGVTYKNFPDATLTDAGIVTGAPVSSVKINMGTGATSTLGGTVANTAKPSFYGSACIMVLSYEVVVPAALAYGTKISVGGGTVSYSVLSGVTASTVTFPADTLLLYPAYGICTNTVGTNAITSEFGGTFGSGKAKDRTPSSKIPSYYTDTVFTNNSPQDYYYGISNNTSAAGTGYSTVNTWAYPDNTLSAATPPNSHRLFSLEDIIGDHTGATNPLLGNPPADTVNSSTGGYMAFINAAYRTDVAFLDTIRNLCPGTYYQYSAWFRNMCSKCSCDSTGKGATSAGYLPYVSPLTGKKDSSGVHPNLTFNVNGYDYYTTGDILYTGNWAQLGFTYITGPTDTTMVINIRNNAPGGGGNDWVIDDIGVATCAPNVQLTPNKPDTLCMSSDDTVRFKVSSYFNSYTQYQIQKSIDGGVTWTSPGTDTTGASDVGTGTPVYNGVTGNYEYVATRYYRLNNTDSLTTYRLIVATTSGNLSNTNCSAYATAQKVVVTANCFGVLATELISFRGRLDNGFGKLQWITTNETPGITYTVERSTDQVHYEAIGTVDGDAVQGLNGTYNFTDPREIAQPTYYRILLQSGKYTKYSTVVLISNANIDFDVQSVTNPFNDWLSFNMTSPDDGIATFSLLDMYGRIVKQQKQNITVGLNSIKMYNLSGVSNGTYTLQVAYDSKIISKHVIKLSSN